MIYGAGIDIIEISRIESACHNPRFLERIFSKAELDASSGRPQTLAGIFAAKEASAKALGTGFSGFSPLDAEILKDELGKPWLNPQGPMLELMENKRVRCAALSISHDKSSAIAFAVMELVDE
jgi:holo-[acyl-carrier protein] synthase